MATKRTIIIITTLFFLAVVALSTAKSLRIRRQFPCDHPLRVFFPEDFAHCETTCLYSDWGNWEVISGSTQNVPESRCKSGEIYTERKTRSAIGNNCNNVTMDRQICVPDAVDRLILFLGLGGIGQNYNSTARRKRRQTSQPVYGPGTRCPRFKNSRDIEVCQTLTRGKRSGLNIEGTLHNNVNEHSAAEIPRAQATHSLEEGHDIMAFSHQEHGRRFRRAISPELCGETGDIQYVLFVLDSSGSIGSDQYERMKIAVANLTLLFCKRVKFALMTFSSTLRQEFCFDCFENTIYGRVEAAEAIKAAPYQHGWTHTGEAARCICSEFLNTSCGISSNPSCLDVVFITDGHSNGRFNVCTEVKNCLHSKTGVNTYAIGIRGHDEKELKCIADNKERSVQNPRSAFEFEDFEEFEDAIREVLDRLRGSGDPKLCAALYGNPPTPTQIPTGENPSG